MFRGTSSSRDLTGDDWKHSQTHEVRPRRVCIARLGRCSHELILSRQGAFYGRMEFEGVSIMVDEHDETVLHTHNGRTGWSKTVERPANYVQMRYMMKRIVVDLKAQGVVDPSNEDVMREYSRRMKKFRNG